MKLQTLIATDASGRVLLDVEIVEGKGRRVTPRKIKKTLRLHPGVVAVSRITTIECSGQKATQP